MSISRREKYRRRRKVLPLLNSWYGRERGAVEFTAYSQEAVNAADLMSELFRKIADEEARNFIEISTRWKEIVPGKLAACAKPARLRDGVLSLEVRHSALIGELSPSLDLFLARIAAAVGEGVCREIRLVPSGSLSRIKR